MAWLPMYLLESDVEFLNDWLNQEEEIAFLVSNGNKRWIAKKQHEIIKDIGTQEMGSGNFKIPNFIEYNLWHIPSGPLPLIKRNKGGVTLRLKKEDWEFDNEVPNPWLGWTELVTGANYRVPYFESHTGIIRLEINLPSNEPIPISNFGWIGNHYSILGSKANPLTEKFWKKLKRMAKKIAIHIPRENQPNGKKEIYAFPDAYKEIKNDRPCDS
jgi:hypothetical protein